jgi:hypothetical protein
MMRRRSTALFLALVLTTLPTGNAFAQTAADKGKAIGETVNAAINAAVPGVTAIGTLLKTLFGSDQKKKLSQEDVNKALSDQATKLKGEALRQLAGLSIAVVEIDAANELANLASVAYESLASARGYATLETDGRWEAFKFQWEHVAKPNLDRVKNFNSSQLGKINNEDIRADWQQFLNQYQQNVANVDRSVAEKKDYFVVQSVDTLRNQLSALATIPSVELRAFSLQLQALASLGGATLQPPPPKDTSSVKELLNKVGSIR